MIIADMALDSPCSFHRAIPTPKPTYNTTINVLDHVGPLLFGFQLIQLTKNTKQIFDLPIYCDRLLKQHYNNMQNMPEKKIIIVSP